jgi:hypothetical protein
MAIPLEKKLKTLHVLSCRLSGVKLVRRINLRDVFYLLRNSGKDIIGNVAKDAPQPGSILSEVV